MKYRKQHKEGIMGKAKVLTEAQIVQKNIVEGINNLIKLSVDLLKTEKPTKEIKRSARAYINGLRVCREIARMTTTAGPATMGKVIRSAK